MRDGEEEEGDEGRDDRDQQDEGAALQCGWATGGGQRREVGLREERGVRVGRRAVEEAERGESPSEMGRGE